MKRPLGCMTCTASTIVQELISAVQISPAFDPAMVGSVPQLREYQAIWDTGATHSVISARVAQECNLKPIAATLVKTTAGETQSAVYLVAIMLPNKVGFPQVRVVEGILADADVLIGMDLITQGDFAVTHSDGKTCFTFRYPSCERIDFVELQKQSKPVQQVTPFPKVGRNDLCPCGSGKKYKYCHGHSQG